MPHLHDLGHGEVEIDFRPQRTRWQSRRRLLLRVSTVLLTLAVVTGGVWGAIAWARYPKVPDVAKADLNETIQFIGTDDFNRMTESHRKKYMLGLTDRLREKSFQDLLALMMNVGPKGRKAAENVNKMRDKEEIGSAFFRVFLDKFYELSASERETYLTMWVMAEKFGGSGGGGGRRGMFGGRGAATRPTTGPSTRPASSNNRQPHLPTPAELEKGMTNFLSHQPPRAAAEVTELMNAMQRKRDALGVKRF